MLSCQKLWFLAITLVLLENHQSKAKPAAAAEFLPGADSSDLPKLKLISDDVIADKIEKDTKMIIRVNPLDLPPLKDDHNILNMDSSLYNIQSLKPYTGKRKYINMRRTKPQNEVESPSAATDTPIIIRGISLIPSPEKTLKPKHQPKKKHLHFQRDAGGNLLSKTLRIHVTPGAYPIYYVVAKTNGRFGKYPLKSFDSAQAFMKYLTKNKLENLPALKTYDEKVV